jgi:gentisate 1,2-dioxygenase
METGDVVLTPGACWHGHGHDGDEPAYWLDGLDVPATHLLEPMFFEEHPDKYVKILSVATSSPYRFTRDAIAAALDRAKPDPDGMHGPRIDLETPDMPSMGLTMERLDSGKRTRRQRSTANRICGGRRQRRDHDRRQAFCVAARRHGRRSDLEQI